jgi:hypothetical protein
LLLDWDPDWERDPDWENKKEASDSKERDNREIFVGFCFLSAKCGESAMLFRREFSPDRLEFLLSLPATDVLQSTSTHFSIQEFPFCAVVDVGSNEQLLRGKVPRLDAPNTFVGKRKWDKNYLGWLRNFWFALFVCGILCRKSENLGFE